MKSNFYYKLNFTDQNNDFKILNFEDQELAQEYYSENLQELQSTGKPFHINMTLIYQILEDDGEKNCTRFYLIAAHNEKGVFDPEAIKEDHALIEQHIESGFISHNPKRVVFPWPADPSIAAIKLEKGYVIGGYTYSGEYKPF